MKVYVMLADGFEEIEAITVVDVLRRGEAETTMVSIKSDKFVLGAHNILIVADTTIEEIEIMPEDMIVIPGGGKGVQKLSESKTLQSLLRKHQEQKGMLAAICAGPTIPGKMGFYNGVKATCYPGCEEELEGAIISNNDVVVDKNFITSKGPANSLGFAYTLLSLIKGEEISEEIQKGMLFI
ncbi:MAG TPA: DJ-1/PfpI family protein [Clostridiaceae bacterium]|nr:DJ-1/PfpI family protein [Clostridiaceae bacterium]